MPQSIENPTDSEIRSVIREVYEENIMSEGMIRKWVRAFKGYRRNAHDEEKSGQPFVITEDLVQKVDGKVRENRFFTISSLSNEFPQVSRSVLYGIVTEHLNYRKLCSLWAGGRFLEDVIQKLVVGYDKCLNIGGNYVEK
ncbi:hypothetical protein AVEN_153635-1 [Araneus ventricosus]|uniref:Mos1 transposase HTH domain-containing protein n=1 Tax=Araneus ventricosus TaxID=182803 RepID=A0A4Y2BQY9_ARAVE|nr:hypothetical protein AVEN_153635-1 [Araneus ventricosus]